MTRLFAIALTALNLAIYNALAQNSSVGEGRLLIRTDLKQDNDYNLEDGGQNCTYKFNYREYPASIQNTICHDDAMAFPPRWLQVVR